MFHLFLGCLLFKMQTCKTTIHIHTQIHVYLIFGENRSHTFRKYVYNKFATNKYHNGIYINLKTMSSMPKRDKYVKGLCGYCRYGLSIVNDHSDSSFY